MRAAVRMLLWAWVVLDQRASVVALPEITDETFIDECERLHNKARSTVSPPASDMLYMTWDEDLAIIARAWANNCVFKHNDNRNSHPVFPSVGENLWAGYPPSIFTVNRAVESWVNENVDYNYKDNNCKETKQCGHYTQVVWANTYKVGCAAQLCPNGAGVYPEPTVLFVCNYAPAGNYINQHPYDAQGPACSRCTGVCQDNLCRSPERDGQKTTHFGRGSYVSILIARPVALLFTVMTAYAVHYKHPLAFCYE